MFVMNPRLQSVHTITSITWLTYSNPQILSTRLFRRSIAGHWNAGASVVELNRALKPLQRPLQCVYR